jgi:hypothetical protein
MCWASRRIGALFSGPPRGPRDPCARLDEHGSHIRLELAHPFGNPATLCAWGTFETCRHQSNFKGPIGFASPPYGGFAFVEDVAVTSNSVPRRWTGLFQVLRASATV